MKLEELFDLDRDTTVFIITMSALLALGLAFKIARSKEVKVWQVSKDGEYHITKDPTTHDGCVYFTDEDGQARKMCGRYKITRI